MKIYGYSERGMINSLIYSIGDDKKLITEFLHLIFPESIIGKPKDYDIFLEQSFSDFGDADLVIIAEYSKKVKKSFFFEAKVKTFLGNWNIDAQYNKYMSNQKYYGWTSNLFYQLYLKQLMIDNFAILTSGVKDEHEGEKIRKLGENEIVYKAINMIGSEDAYYVGIVPIKKEMIDKFLIGKDINIHFLLWETIHEFCNDNNLTKVLEMFDYNGEQIYKK